MHRYRIEFADEKIVTPRAPDIQRAISAAIMDRCWIVFTTGIEAVVEVVGAEIIEEENRNGRMNHGLYLPDMCVVPDDS